MQAIGGAIGAIGLIASGLWAWWLKNQRAQAQTRADVAESGADLAVADAQRIVYTTLVERVTTLENEVRSMREELAGERRHNRMLVLHIWKLEGLMRKAGLDPPPFDDTPAMPAETKQ